MAEAEDAARARKKAACFIMVVFFSCVRLCGGCWRGGGVVKKILDLAWLDLGHSSQGY